MKQSLDSSVTETIYGAEAYALDRKAVVAILYAVDIADKSRLLPLVAPLDLADIVDLLEQVSTFDRYRLIDVSGGEFDDHILAELDGSILKEVITALKLNILAESVRDLESDEVVDLLEDLQESKKSIILGFLPEPDRIAVEKSLTYPEFSAGRLVQREVVMAPEYWTVGEAVNFLRNAKPLPEQFCHVTLVDLKLQPLANITLGKLMSSRRDVALETTKQHLPWLEINLVSPILVSLVIAQFWATIKQLVALASMGGNAETQSLAVVVRALATRDLTLSNLWRVVGREAVFGLLNGVVFAVVIGGVGLIWFGSPTLGYVIAMAMVINLIVVGLVGTLVPVVLDRFGIDPVLRLGASVTTITQGVGFSHFFGWLHGYYYEPVKS